MSYREQRNFIEILRHVGYPLRISFSSFTRPNFMLVSDILFFLVNRLDPTLAARINDEISTEGDRIAFLKQIAQLMAIHMRIKLNTKRLYAADTRAVQEMLKLASVLDRAIRAGKLDDGSETSAIDGMPPLSSKVGDIRRCKSLASEITQQGAELSDMLKKEDTNRENRHRVLTSNLELEQVADQIRTQISVVSEQVTNVEENLANLTSDEKNLEAKIEKKRHTLERKQQRLKSMATVRPAHQDEYEACEAQLREQYASYLEKFRNQEYLEHQLDRHLAAQKQEADEHDRNLRRMQERLRIEEAEMMRAMGGGFGKMAGPAQPGGYDRGRAAAAGVGGSDEEDGLSSSSSSLGSSSSGGGSEGGLDSPRPEGPGPRGRRRGPSDSGGGDELLSSDEELARRRTPNLEQPPALATADDLGPPAGMGYYSDGSASSSDSAGSVQPWALTQRGTLSTEREFSGGEDADLDPAHGPSGFHDETWNDESSASNSDSDNEF